VLAQYAQGSEFQPYYWGKKKKKETEFLNRCIILKKSFSIHKKVILDLHASEF
jgi:hypothetical protein